MSNIKDVAALAGVAPSTVSNVFTQNKHVSSKITKKVREACEKLNYTPSLIASSMRTRKTQLIGLMLSSSENGFPQFYNEVVEGAVITAAERGYSVIVYYGIANKEKLQGILENGRSPIEGAILLTPRREDFRFIEMEKNKIPFILIGQESCGEVSFVDVRNDQIVYDITKKMLGEGKKQFVFLNSEEELSISKDRYNGFVRALQEAGLPEHEVPKMNIVTDRNVAKQAALKLLRPDTDAVIAESDISAAGVYDALAEMNRSPSEVKVCALGGTSVAGTLTPPVTTVEVDYRALAVKGMSLLLDNLCGKECMHENFIDAKILYR